MADMAGKLRCVIVTPEGQIADRSADFVVLTAHDGQFGILPDRTPLLCKLGPGMLRIDEQSNRQRHFYFVAEGFAEVIDNTVTVITTEAIAAENIDPEAVERELADAKNLPVKTDEQFEHRSRAVRIAEGKAGTARLGSGEKMGSGQ